VKWRLRRENRMTPKNGKAEKEAPHVALDVEHELPASEGAEEQQPSGDGQGAAAELDAAKRERDALYDRVARLQAEFDNFRKRSQREQAEFREYAGGEAVKGFLPVLDSLDRAFEHAAEGSELRSGLELVRKQFLDALQRAGVQPIAAVGQPFDPALHEAIEMVETEEVPDHHVVDEFQRGYKIKERLLRPAMVRVAKNPKS